MKGVQHHRARHVEDLICSLSICCSCYFLTFVHMLLTMFVDQS